MGHGDIENDTDINMHSRQRKFNDTEGFVAIEGGDVTGYVTYVFEGEHHPISAQGGVEKYPLPTTTQTVLPPDTNVEEPALDQEELH